MYWREKMDEIIKSLESLDRQIQDAKRNVAVQEGRLKENLQQLKNEFNIDNLDDAIKEESILLSKIEIDKKQIEEKFAKLKEQYDW